MEYSVNDLIRKIEMLNSNSAQNHIREIESLLRDINNQQSIPRHLYRKISLALINIDKKREHFANSSVPYIVDRIIKKMKSGQLANVGEMLDNGNRYMRKSLYASNAAYKILSKFGIPLFRI